MTSYALAIGTSKDDDPGQRMVDIEAWAPPRVFSELTGSRPEACADETDILDHAFVAFHRSLRAFMMDRYGLMIDSEAFDLHAAIAPCISLSCGSAMDASCIEDSHRST